MRNTLNPISSKHFCYKNGTFTACLSDLPIKGFRLIWDNCPDYGIAVKSEKTNKVVTFYVTKEERQDGELQSYELKPIRDDIKKNKALANISMTLFND